MKEKKKLTEYLIYTGVAWLIFLIGALAWGLFDQTEWLSIFKIISDCFCLPAVFFIGFSLLGWVGSKGTFDMFGYTWQGFLAIWKKESYFSHESYYDYRQKRDAKRKAFNWPMLLVGVACLLLGLAAMIVFLIME